MGSVWSVGLVNCHISDKNNMSVVNSMKLDICGVVETWFRGKEGKARRDGILQNTNFVWVGKDREGRRGGGIGFLVRKGVKLRIPKGGRAEGLLWIEVEDGKGKFFLKMKKGIFLIKLRINLTKYYRHYPLCGEQNHSLPAGTKIAYWHLWRQKES